jgi:hypothetical protein
MKKNFKKEVREAFDRTSTIKPEILEEKDMQHLPAAVKKYLNYVGAVGKEKVSNFRMTMDGKIRSDPDDKWMILKSEQFNFYDKPTRIFYITAKKMGIPAVGLHLYKNEKAIMVIKLAGIFKIVDSKGKEMDQGETVTVFNDMCFMAPATLIDKSMEWEEVDPLTVKAKYTNGKITIGATLYFNEKGELINFVSTDRFETIDGKTFKNYPWSTPTGEYKNINGFKLASSAQAIYHRPGIDFCYAEFYLDEVRYNITG